jgi:hypothetical protein
VSGIVSAEDHEIVGMDHHDGTRAGKTIGPDAHETLAKDLAGMISDLDGIIDHEITGGRGQSGG